MNNDYELIMKQAETLKNHPVEDMILELINTQLYDLGLDLVSKNDITFREKCWCDGFYGTLTLLDDKYYDLICSSENGSVDTEFLSARYSSSIKLSNGFHLDGDIVISCKLPKEDFELFEAIGKVITELQPQKATKSIICEV